MFGNGGGPGRVGAGDRRAPFLWLFHRSETACPVLGTKSDSTNIEHNYIVVFMIPDLIELGSPCPWAVLPPGIHDTTLAEVEARFATTPHRKRLFGGFVRMAQALAIAGCNYVYLDGSFVTAKPHPGDYDGCWDQVGVDPNKLDPVLLDFNNKRAAQKAKYLGEMFIAGMPNGPGGPFLDFFQVEKSSGQAKGILRIPLAPLKGATP